MMHGAPQLLPCGPKSRRGGNTVRGLRKGPAGWVQAQILFGAQIACGMDAGAERSIVQGKGIKVATRNSGIGIQFVLAKGSGVSRDIHREAAVLKLGTTWVL